MAKRKNPARLIVEDPNTPGELRDLMAGILAEMLRREVEAHENRGLLPGVHGENGAAGQPAPSERIL